MSDSKWSRDGDGNFHHEDHGDVDKSYDGSLRHSTSKRVVGHYDALTDTVRRPRTSYDDAVDKTMHDVGGAAGSGCVGFLELLVLSGPGFIVMGFVLMGLAAGLTYSGVLAGIRAGMPDFDSVIAQVIAAVCGGVAILLTLVWVLRRFWRHGWLNSGALFVTALVGVPVYGGALGLVYPLGLSTQIGFGLAAAAGVIVGGFIGLVWRSMAASR